MHKLTKSQTQKTLANACLFCKEELTSPTLCKFCGFKFCEEHMPTENHQCIKTRYIEYVKKSDQQPNISNGRFRVVCNTCGYVSKKPTSIEYAGEELIQHMQLVGCPQNIFLEEVTSKTSLEKNVETDTIKEEKSTENELQKPTITSNTSNETSVVEQILKLSSFKEKGMISDEEFEFIKKELIKKLK